MNHTGRSRLGRRGPFVLLAVLATIACVVALVWRDGWLPQALQLLAPGQQDGHETPAGQGTGSDDRGEADLHAGQSDAGQSHAGHAHAASDDATSLRLSQQAQKNIGLKLVTIELGDFDRTITVPATVVERPGRTQIKVSAPMTGIVTRTYPIRGEAVTPGERLFELRLTHEDLVEIQSLFLQTVEQLDVVKREVARLDQVTSSGAIAGKRLLERQYERQKTEALLRAQGQALILHGLTQQQVDDIASNRELLKEVTIFVPQPAEQPAAETGEHLLQVSRIEVDQGQHVAAGDPLCVLSDHDELYIEGKAFEEDDQALSEAATLGTPITAIVEGNGKGTHSVSDLRILYVENEVELQSRALRFYLRLPNQVVRNEKTADGHRFIGWRYKPGQRVELVVPVERWAQRIVLPVDAVIKEGAESFVFRQAGDRFDRKPVHVEYRDPRWAVIENDGTLFPGDVVVGRGANQMHWALKNQAGGGVDPHAGHSH